MGIRIGTMKMLTMESTCHAQDVAVLVCTRLGLPLQVFRCSLQPQPQGYVDFVPYLLVDDMLQIAASLCHFKVANFRAEITAFPSQPPVWGIVRIRVCKAKFRGIYESH